MEEAWRLEVQRVLSFLNPLSLQLVGQADIYLRNIITTTEYVWPKTDVAQFNFMHSFSMLSTAAEGSLDINLVSLRKHLVKMEFGGRDCDPAILKGRQTNNVWVNENVLFLELDNGLHVKLFSSRPGCCSHSSALTEWTRIPRNAGVIVDSVFRQKTITWQKETDGNGMTTETKEVRILVLRFNYGLQLEIQVGWFCTCGYCYTAQDFQSVKIRRVPTDTILAMRTHRTHGAGDGPRISHGRVNYHPASRRGRGRGGRGGRGGGRGGGSMYRF